MTQTHVRFRTAGFSIVELMMVIAVLGLLLALLMPAARTFKDMAKSAVCLSRERQLTTSTLQYAPDYSQYLPRAEETGNSGSASWNSNLTIAQQQQGTGLWFNALDDYMGYSKLQYTQGNTALRNYINTKQCPFWEDAVIKSNNQNGNFTLKMNQYLTYDLYQIVCNAESTTTPLTVPLFVKTNQIARNTGPVVLYFDGISQDVKKGDSANALTLGYFETGIAMRHGDRSRIVSGVRLFTGGTNVAFTDGSAKTIYQPYQVSSNYPIWNPDCPANRTANYQQLNWHINERVLPLYSNTLSTNVFQQ